MKRPDDTQWPRQLVLLMDGTGNTLTGGHSDTNVLKTHMTLAGLDFSQQSLYYSSGVGANSRVVSSGILGKLIGFARRIPGLAVGDGVIDNIASAYSFLLEKYQEGDEIYIFGFSRGAFAALCLADIVTDYGLIRDTHSNMVDQVLALYFTPQTEQNSRDRSNRSYQARRFFAHERKVKIKFLGLWDAVASVGIPLISYLDHPRPPTAAHLEVSHIRHALALHEYRRPYEARCFPEANFVDATADKSLVQKWFRGAHCDVGGGYPSDEDRLSDVPLRWMWHQAYECGLRIYLPWPEFTAACIQHDEAFRNPLWLMAGLRRRHSRPPPDARLTVAEGSAERDVVSEWTRSRWGTPLRTVFAIALMCWAVFGLFAVLPSFDAVLGDMFDGLPISKLRAFSCNPVLRLLVFLLSLPVLAHLVAWGFAKLSYDPERSRLARWAPVLGISVPWIALFEGLTIVCLHPMFAAASESIGGYSLAGAAVFVGRHLSVASHACQFVVLAIVLAAAATIRLPTGRPDSMR